jgi:hypothetical protein
MNLGQRLRRVEEAHTDRVFRKEAERLAAKYNVDPDEVLQTIREINERVAVGGLDAELRHLAEEMGVSEEEARARYEEARREIGAEDAAETAITIEG